VQKGDALLSNALLRDSEVFIWGVILCVLNVGLLIEDRVRKS